MPKNMAILDRVLRAMIAVVVLALYVTGQISGTAAIILGVLAMIFLLTGIFGYCPLYHLFSFSTRKK